MANVNLIKQDNSTKVNITKGATQKALNSAVAQAESYRNESERFSLDAEGFKNDSSLSASQSAISATASAASATSSSTSATNATTQANIATAKASEASTSASNALVSETNASTYATNASNSATASSNSATASASSAIDSANSATASATSESNAATSALSASASATTATTQATNASTSASNAAISATNASVSETNSAASELNASNSEAAAQGYASDAQDASVNASGYATSASNSASAASTSASNASISEGNALTYSNNASTSATNAATSESNANASATIASNALATFQGQYTSSATEPTSPDAGDLWFDETVGIMKVYNGSIFIAAGSSVNGTAERFVYTATQGQTTFSAIYDAGYVDVYVNGIKLQATVDFTATNGTNIIMTSGLNLNDVVDIIAYGTFSVADTYTQATIDTMLANIDALPDQTGNTGKFLKTDGTNATWEQAGVGKVLQVVQVQLTSVFASSSSSWVDIGWSASITPTSNTSKILVQVQLTDLHNSTQSQSEYRVLKNGNTFITGVTGDLMNFSTSYEGSGTTTSGGMSYLDSPASESQLTYSMQYRNRHSALVTLGQDWNSNSFAGVHTITLTEIAN